MSELNALLSFAVIQNTEEIIENKYKIAEKYIQNVKDLMEFYSSK